MAPKKSSTSRTKRSANLSQPILSFQSRKPLPDRKLSNKSSLKPSASESSLPPSPAEDVHEIHLDTENADIPDVNVEPEQGKVKVRGDRRRLDVKSKEWDGLRRNVKKEMGGLKPIHAGPDTHDDIHHILRIFDMTSRYGPAVGITRLQRWERAKKWGLNPPEEIHTILTTEQGEDDPAYRENVLYGWLG